MKPWAPHDPSTENRPKQVCVPHTGTLFPFVPPEFLPSCYLLSSYLSIRGAVKGHDNHGLWSQPDPGHSLALQQERCHCCKMSPWGHEYKSKHEGPEDSWWVNNPVFAKLWVTSNWLGPEFCFLMRPWLHPWTPVVLSCSQFVFFSAPHPHLLWNSWCLWAGLHREVFLSPPSASIVQQMNSKFLNTVY